MMETEQRQERRWGYSLGDLVGFYAYLFAVGGAIPDRTLVRGILRGPGAVTEVLRTREEESRERDEVGAAA